MSNATTPVSYHPRLYEIAEMLGMPVDKLVTVCRNLGWRKVWWREAVPPIYADLLIETLMEKLDATPAKS